MNQHCARCKDESGQAMIQVIVTMLVIIGFVALAVDFGRAYSDRRNLQNAADAAALAGARELCLGNSNTAAVAKARDYLTRNGVAAGDIGTNDILVAGNVIDVVARHNGFAATLGRLVNWPAFNDMASARAACGAAQSACGLWPMALSTKAWQDVTQTSGGACVERTMVIWNDDEQGGGAKTPTCVVGGTPQTNLCNCYQCPKDSNGKPIIFVASEGRAWLDFTSVTDSTSVFKDACTGSGTNFLNCQISRNTSAKINVPACLDGLSGVRASTEKEIDDRSGDFVKIPLYDSMGCKPGKDTYQISSFGCFKVVAAGQVKNVLVNSNIDPLPAYSTLRSISKNEKVVLATSDCSNSCTTQCGSTSGTAAGIGQIKAVSLIR